MDGYKYKKDKQTGKWSKEPLERDDDRIAGLRYATEEIKEGYNIPIKDIPKETMEEIRQAFNKRNNIYV